MCTLIAIKGRADVPLILGGNRDELYTRPAAGPRVLHDRPRVVGGVDLEKGGSWLAVNENGHFVALTNQRSYDGADPSLASRGHLVIEAASEPDLAGVERYLSRLDARRYNSFNLLYGDADTLRVAYARSSERTVATHPLSDGVWVLSNARMGSPEFPKTLHAEALITPRIEGPLEPLLAALEGALADHEQAPLSAMPDLPEGSPFDPEILRQLQALCVHTPFYGTRSATMLGLEKHGVAWYRFAEGPLCEAALEDVTELLRGRADR